MGILLNVAGLCIPRFVRQRELEKLFAAAADAFGVDAPPRDNISFEGYLLKFALFTRDHAAAVSGTASEANVKEKLYHNACRLGAALRGEFGVKSIKDAMKLARIVYAAIGIDFRGEPDGTITVNRCLFSSYYGPEVCSIISSLDAGLLAGLTGGGRLTFQQRITEGHESCRARISLGVRSA